MLNGIKQVAHPRGSNRLRAAIGTPPRRLSWLQAQVQLALTGRQPLPRRGLQHLQFRIVIGRTDVLDIPRPAPPGVHDLHRRRTQRRLHRP
jgi:hypothetical protein